MYWVYRTYCGKTELGGYRAPIQTIPSFRGVLIALAFEARQSKQAEMQKNPLLDSNVRLYLCVIENVLKQYDYFDRSETVDP